MNKGLILKIWSDVHNAFVNPIFFNNYQLHGDEGAADFDIDQSILTRSTSTNATYDIAEGASCIVQAPASIEDEDSDSLCGGKFRRLLANNGFPRTRKRRVE